MGSLKNKLVFITGASSGIGRACAEAFAAHEAKLVIGARRFDRLEKLTQELQEQYRTFVKPVEMDVRNHMQVEQTIAQLEKEFEIDILVNNAGLARGLDPFHQAALSDWEEMIDTNVKGLLYVTRAILPGMMQRNRGHIVNIGSVAGREVYPKGSVYCATKSAVKALSQALRIDTLGHQIRVTNIEPGLVETEFSLVRFHGDRERAGTVYEDMTPLTAEDVADAIIYATTRPAHVNIAEIFIMPTAQASSMLVHRAR